MAKAYSLELREKVMAFLGGGKKRVEAMEVFRVSRKTVYRWERRQEAGMLAATKVKERKPKKLDPEKLRAYIMEHPEETLKQIGAAFGATDVSVLSRVRQLGISYKKKSFYIKKGTKINGKGFEN
jgi:putative transposase